jgi:transcriptional regulator with XRE-family HTH domain
MKIGMALREARLAVGLAQNELARQMQVSPGFLSDLEKGRRVFYDRYLDRLPESIRATVAMAVAEEYKAMIAKIYADNDVKHLMKE